MNTDNYFILTQYIEPIFLYIYTQKIGVGNLKKKFFLCFGRKSLMLINAEFMCLKKTKIKTVIL